MLGGVGAAGAAEVQRFTPEGLARGVRQATARFSEAMVPIGDPRGAEDPFEISCDGAGQGQWVDSRTWVYDFDRNLAAGARCTFRLKAGTKSLAGAAVTGRQEFSFSTGGPAITQAIPPDGDKGIDEEQAFVLVLDGEADPASVLAHVGFAVDGLADRVGVRLVTGKLRAAILAAEYRQDRDAPRPPGAIVVLQPRQRFPSRARVRLVWGAGVQTPGGVATARDQVLAYQVRPPFTATFRCERENRQAGCIPVTPMVVEFSAPVRWQATRGVALVAPDGRRFVPPAPEARQRDDGLVWRVELRGPFPESTSFRLQLPAGLKDDAGRALQNAGAFPLTVKTEAFPPLAKFASRFGIVEAKADPTLPVTLRNLEPDVQARLLRVDQKPNGGSQGLGGWVRGNILRIPPEHSDEILPWLRKVGVADRETSVFGGLASGGAAGGASPPSGGAQPGNGNGLRSVVLPRPDGNEAFQVVGIPLGQPGLYIVELESARLGASLLGKAAPLYVPTAALVTNLSVHLLRAPGRSLAWVTALDTGQPISGARVSVYDCRGALLWRGASDRQGIAWFNSPTAPKDSRCPTTEAKHPFYDWSQVTALTGLGEGLFVVAQTVDDLSFVHSSWDQGIEPWRFRLPTEDEDGGVVAHSILDRSLLRAGDTLHLKHLLRAKTVSGFGRVAAAARPTRLSLRHVGSDEHYDLPLEWDAAGVAESLWRIPPGTRLGRYEVVLVRPAPPKTAASGAPSGAAATDEDTDRSGQQEWVSARFRVEEFRVPSMKGVLTPPADPLVAVAEFPLDLAVGYLAGGAAAGQPVVVRTQVRPHTPATGDDLEGFAMANGGVREGLVRRAVSDDEGDGEEASAPDREDGGRPGIHQRDEVKLDAAGSARVIIKGLPKATTPREVLAELEFRDPSGDVQTVATTVPLWPSRLLVGIRPDDWVASKERLKAMVAVTDVAGRPAAGVGVGVDLFTQQAYSHRKRLVGGFYAYEHVEETKKAGELCRGVTGPNGLFVCEGPAPAEGEVVLQAEVADEAGRVSVAHQSVWVAGSEAWWFETKDHDRMDLLPERRRYEPGETARLQVRMPFREATALVTVGREGIQDARVVSLAGTAPVVEVPVKGHYAPNTFVSVLAVRGRVGDVQPTALVDLGRPAFKLGIAELRVGWKAHELKVSVTSDRAVYRVREQARVRVSVRTPEGAAPPPGSEVTLAAVDEGLLELAGNPSWSVLAAMMGRRSYQVAASTAQMQVVGRRHYGKKAVASGGSGGRQPTRELFDTLLLWKGRVTLDAQGDATVEVPLNDSLTAFRIVAVVTGGDDRFGTGETSIRATQELMVLPGVPPLVREGDRLRAQVTLRNTTARPLEVLISGRVEGLPTLLAAQTLTLASGEARISGWDVVVPAGRDHLVYEWEAGEAGGPRDRVKVTQRVVPAVPVRTVQATLLQWQPSPGSTGALRETVRLPAGAAPGRGGVEVVLDRTLLDGLDGVRAWMRAYPYTCLEQRVSRAVALSDESRWRDIVASLPSYTDDEGFLRYFPGIGPGSEVLTAYVLAIAHEAGWAIPDDVAERLFSALKGFVEGKVRSRFALPTTDLSIRKVVALEALARYGKAEAAQLGAVAVEPTLWPTSAVLDWWSLLARLPDAPNRARRMAEAEQVVRARLTVRGTTLGFSTEGRDGLWWLMATPDVNAARLVLLRLGTAPTPGTGSGGGLALGGAARPGAGTGVDLLDDVPRLVRSALARQRRGAWDTTVANAWGTLAMARFSRAFEKDAVQGVTVATLGGESRQLDWAGGPAGGTLGFPAPAADAEVSVDHQGQGRPWVTVAVRAAVPLTAPVASGYRVTKTVTPLEPRPGGALRSGDLLRVRLEIDAQADMTWVVVDDPIPAGASHIGTGLGRDSEIATRGESWRGRAWLAYQERGFESFRAYYTLVPKGTFAVEYTLRLGPSGRFLMPATRVEALYAPDVYGETPNLPVVVVP